MDILIHYNSIYWVCIMILFTVTFWQEKSQRIVYSAVWAFVYLLLIDFTSLLLLSVLTLFTWLVIKQEKTSGQKAFVASFMVFSLLLYYKVRLIAKGASIFSAETFIPLGVSYYTLRCIHVIVEKYKGTFRKVSFKELFSYLFFLPTLWIGPIHRFTDFTKDVRRHRWEPRLFLKGIERIVYGYFKIYFVTELVLNQSFSDLIVYNQLSSWASTYLQMVKAGLTLYIQFSGYSDIAIGFSLLLGIRVMENFKFPYFQKNISDFWKSWHISLTSWCQEYIYNPVIAQTRSPQLAVICSIIVMALWHEVSLRYILWGTYHAIGILVWHVYHHQIGRKVGEGRAKVVDIFGRLLTLHFVWLGFFLVRQPDLPSMVGVLHKLFNIS